VITKNLVEISSVDIQTLVDNSACESTTLEFKRNLPGSGDEAKREFLADVSALANTSGGDLLYGVAEENGCASAITGIGTQDTDAVLLRLSNILHSGLEPRIRYTSRIVECAEETVLLLRVEKSWNAPHRVVFKSYDRFFGRNAAGKYPLDVQQLRHAFIENSSVAERMRNFRADRLASIIAGATPVLMEPGSKFVIHMLPFEAFFSEPRHDLAQQLPTNDFRPLSGGGWSSRLTFEGKLVVAGANSVVSPSYLHLYRNGVIEMVDAVLLSRSLPGDSEPRLIPAVYFEQFVFAGVQRGLQLLLHIGATAPVAVAITLTGVKNMILGTDEWRYGGLQNPILNDHLFLPEAVLPELTTPIHPALRPTIDLVWNACGIAQSRNFDEDNNWVPPR
jgi:Putative DNA-binding domain